MFFGREMNSTLGTSFMKKRIMSFLAHFDPVFLNKASKETLYISRISTVCIFSRKENNAVSSTGKPLFQRLLRAERLPVSKYGVT